MRSALRAFLALVLQLSQKLLAVARQAESKRVHFYILHNIFIYPQNKIPKDFIFEVQSLSRSSYCPKMNDGGEFAVAARTP